MKQRIIWMLGGAILTVVVFVLAQQFIFGTTSAEQISQEEAEQIVLNAYSGDIQEVEEDSSHYSVRVSLPSGSYTVFVNKQSGELEDLRFDSSNESESEPNLEKEEDEPENRTEDEEDNQEEFEQEQEPEEDKLLTKDDILGKLEDDYSGNVVSVNFSDGEEPYYGVEIEEDNEVVFIVMDAETGEIIDEQTELKTQTPISEDKAVNLALNKFNGEIDDIDYKEINGTLYYLIEVETDDQDVIVRINALNGEAVIIWDENTDEDDDDGDN